MVTVRRKDSISTDRELRGGEMERASKANRRPVGAKYGNLEPRVLQESQAAVWKVYWNFRFQEVWGAYTVQSRCLIGMHGV